MVRDGDADEERSDPVLNDDSPGPLAELLFSSPVNGAFSGADEVLNEFGSNGSNGSNGNGNGTFGHNPGANGHNGQGQDGYTDEQLLRPFEDPNGSDGRTEPGTITPPVFPGAARLNVPGAGGDVPEADLSTVQTPGNADDFADELAALFLPVEPNGPVKPEAAPRQTIAGQAVDRKTDSGIVPKEDRPVKKSTLHADIKAADVPPVPLTASAPIIPAAPIQESAPSNQPPPVRTDPILPGSSTTIGQFGAAATTSTSPGAPAVLQYSTEANPPPQGLQWSTVVHEPSHSGGPASQPLHDQALFDGGQQGMGGPLRFEATSAGAMPQSQGGRLSEGFLAATERRWFWGAVAGAVTLSCLVVAAAFIGLRDTDSAVDTDSALATVDSDDAAANQQPAGQSGAEQESAASAQLTPTSLQVQTPAPAAPAVRPPTPGSTDPVEAPTPTTIDPTTTAEPEEETTATSEPEEETTTTTTTEPEPEPDPVETTTPPTTEPEPEPDPVETTTPPTSEPEPEPDPVETTTPPTSEPEPEPDPEETTTTTTTVVENPDPPAGPDDPPGQTP